MPRARDAARKALANALGEERLPPRLVLDAWLEHENDQRGLPPGTLAATFAEQVATVARFAEVRDGALSARLGALKQELLARRSLRYNRNATTLAHFLIDHRLQCRSGSIAVILAWTAAASDARARPVFIHTNGHVQPGLLVGRTLLVTEATTTDAAVSKHRLARVNAMRVTDALDELALMLVPEAPAWLRERALIRDAAAEGRKSAPDNPDGLPFGFGAADIPPGDLALPRLTPEAGPIRYGEEPAPSSDPTARLIAVSGGRGGAAPIFASEPSASGVFNLVFCEDVRPWKRIKRAQLRGLEHDLVAILGSTDLSNVRVSFEEDCALVGVLPSFTFGTASAAVRLLLREDGTWRERQRATIETVQLPTGCQCNWKFCALKPPKLSSQDGAPGPTANQE